MRAAFFLRNGPPEVLEIGEMPFPQMGGGQVLVRVHASSVNPIDCYIRRGGLRRFSRVPFPRIPGVDMAGTVEKCGSGEKRFRPGDEVFAFIPTALGGCAEFAVLEASWLAKQPRSLGHVESAVVPCVGMTALQGLRDKTGLQAGQSVLIVGASGGVGSMAVQVAKVIGAVVTAVCSTPNVAFVEKMGADSVIDYLKDDPLSSSRRFDAVFDCIGNSRFGSFCRLLKPKGVHVGISCNRQAVMDSILSRLTPGRKSFQFHVQAIPRDLEQLATWIDEGKIRPVVSQVFQLEQIAEAHRQCETRRTVGKIAVQIVQERFPARCK